MNAGSARPVTRAIGAIVVLVVSMLTWASSPAVPVSVQPYTVAFQTNQTGSVVLVGNTLMSCPTATTGCTNARAGTGSSLNDNDFNMTWVNADPSPGTSGIYASSSASWTLPTGAQVLYAQLAWGARTQAGNGGSNATGSTNKLLWKKPGDTSYSTITATTTYSGGSGFDSGTYHSFVDVTSVVKTAGPGTYWGANISAATGADRMAGWSLVMVISDPAQPLRNLSVYNGLSVIQAGTAGESVTISGFLAPKSGPVNASVGVVVYEGDLGFTGDQMNVQGNALGDGVVPSGNFFNSGQSTVGVLQTARSPAYINNLGYDVKSVSANGILPNGATSATVSLTTNGDTYSPGVITTSINLYSPNFPPPTKVVTNLSGSEPASVGDILQYTIDYPNNGLDGAAGSVLSDPLPPNVSYVAGSMLAGVGTIGSTITMGPVTDVPNDDVGEYTAGSNTITVRIGTGASKTAGGLIAVNGQARVTFKVKVLAAAAGTTISNTDILDYSTATTGTRITRSGFPATIAVKPQADLSITKTGTPSPLAAGQNITYTLTMANAGPNPATTVQIIDDLPLSLTFVSATPSQGGPCTAAGSRVTCPIGTVASGAGATVTVVATMPPGTTGISSVANVASVASATDDPVPANNTATVITPIVIRADVAAGVAVTSPAGAVTPGGTAQLTFTATNNGPSTAQSVGLTANLSAFPGATTSTPGCSIAGGQLTCSAASLAPGQVFTAVVTVTVPPGTTASSIPVTAAVSTTTPDPVPANDSATTSVPVGAPSADLSVTKSASPASSLVAGQQVVWTVKVNNAGPSTATTVTLTDPLPAGVTLVDLTPTSGTCVLGPPVVCSIASISPGGSVTISLTGSLSNAYTAATVANTATVTAATADPTPGNNSATSTVSVVTSADVSLTKTATPAPAVPGSNITFTLTATNTGPSVAQAVSVSDPLPGGFTFVSASGPGGACTAPPVGSTGTVTCPVGALAPGASGTVTIVALIPSGATSPVTNTATVSSTTPDPTPGNNSASYLVTTAATADVAIVKAVTTALPLVGGRTVSWTLTVTNRGPSNATSVVATDVVPPAFVIGVTATAPSFTCSAPGGSVTCALGTLVSGQSVVITVTGTVVGLPPGGLLTNTANVSSATTDPTSSNNASTTTSAVTTQADLTLTKSSAAPTVLAGNQITYTLAFGNSGPSTAVTPTLIDLLPPGETFISASTPFGWSCSATTVRVTCTNTGNLTAGQTGTITLIVAVASSVPLGTTLTNSATVSSPTPGASATATASVDVQTQAGLSVVKSSTPASFVAGSSGTYLIVVSNAGPSDAQSVTLSDPLPAGLSFVGVSTSAGTCSSAAGAVSCSFGVVPPGATITVTVDVTVSSSATGSITNTATVASPTPGSGTRTGSATSPIVASADLRIVKSASTTATAAGSGVTFTLTVVNTGPSDAVAAVATDVLPAGFSFLPGTSSAGCTATGASVTCSAGTLAAGQTASFVIDTVVAPGAAIGSVTNTATVTSATPDPFPANNTSSVTIAISQSADVSVVKAASQSIPTGGTSFFYDLTAANNGPSDAPAAVITDVLPAALTFVSSPGGACTASGQTVTCALGTLSPNALRTVSIVVSIAPSTPAGLLTNTATIASAAPDPVPTDNTGSSTVTVQNSADVVLTKAITTSPIVAGRPVTFRLDATNPAGPSFAFGPIFSDPVPPGTTFVSGSVPGGSCTLILAGSRYPSPPLPAVDTVECTSTSTIAIGATLTATLTFATSPSLTGTLSNSAEVATASGDPDDSNNVATASGPVTTAAAFTVTKIADASPVVPGQAVGWTINITNTGPSDAQGVLVADVVDPAVSGVTVSGAGCTTLPCTVPTVAAGATVSVRVAGALAPSFSGATLDNTATITSTTTGASTFPASVSTPAAPQASLLVTKGADSSPFVSGSLVSWTISISNPGPSDAQGVVVTDLIDPAVTGVTVTGAGCSALPCTIATIVAGGSAAVHVSGTLASTYALPTLANTAIVRSTTTGSQSYPASSTTPVTQTAALAVTKTATTSPFVPGGTVSWTVRVTNTGPSSSTGVTVADTVDPAVSAVTISSSQGSCTSLPCTLGTLGPSQSATIQITGTLDPSYSGTTLANQADATSTTTGSTVASGFSSTPVVPQASFSVSKIAGSASFVAGGPVSWTIAVTNNGPSDAHFVTIADPVDPAVGAVAVTGSGCSALPCTIPTLSAGGTVQVQVSGTLAPSYAAASIANTATITSATSGGATFPASSSTPVVAQAALAITKSAVRSPFVPGQSVGWTIVVSSVGLSDAAGVQVTDVIDPTVTGVTVTSSQGGCAAFPCLLGTIAAGASATITVSGSLPASSPLLTLDNTANVTASTPGTTPRSSSTSTPVVPLAGFSVDKQADSASFVPGQVVSWTITVTNPGPSDAQQVLLADTVNPSVAGVVVSGGGCSALPCTIATLVAGATATVHVSGTLSAAFTAATLDNVVTVSSTTTGPATTLASSSTPVVPAAGLSVVKTADASPFIPGQAVGWTIVVTNAGPSDAQFVVVGDPVDPAVTSVAVTGAGCTAVPCTIPTLAAGATATIHVTGVLPASSAVTSIVNTASVSSDTTGSATFTSTTTTPVSAVASFAVTKTADSSPFVAGQPVSWTIGVTNTGPSDAQNVLVADAVDPAVTALIVTGAGCTALPCTIPTLAAGATVQVLVSGTLAAGFTGSLDNTVHVSSATSGATDFPASSSTPVVAVSAFTVTKDADIGTFVPGQTVSWTITITESGPSAAVNVPVADTVPAVVSGVTVSGACTALPCTIASLAPGATATIHVSGTLAPSFNGATLTNTVTVTDPSSGQPYTATSITPVVAQASFTVVKTPGAPSFTPGSAVSWALTVTNTGPSDAVAVAVTDTVDTAVSGLTVTGAGCTGLPCAIPLLAAGATATISVSGTLDPAYVAATLDNTVTVTSATSGASPFSASSSTPVVPQSSFTITKTADLAGFTAGSAVSWTVVVTNAGPSDAQAVVVTDALDPAVSAVVVSGGGCTSVPCTIPTVPAGASVTVLIAGVLSPSFAGTTLGNSATVTSPSSVPVTATSSTPVTTLASFSISKVASLARFVPGATVGWTVIVTNTGPSDALGVVVADPVNPAVSAVTVSGAGCSAFPCTIGVLAAGASATITVSGTLAASYTGVTLDNVASVTSTTPSTTPASAATSTPVAPSAAFSVTKVAGASTFTAGLPVSWTITVTNTGISDAQNVLIDDTLDPALSGITVSGAGCTSSLCTIATLAAGASVTVTVTGTLASSFPDTTLDNVVDVTSTTTGATVTSATASTPVITATSLAVTKVADASPFIPGRAISWTITVTNAGPSDAQSVTVADVLDPAVSNIGVIGGGCGGLPCVLPTVAAGQTVVLSVLGTLSPSYTATTLSNSVSVSSPTPGSTTATATATTPVAARASLLVTKSANAPSFVAGGPVSWTITVQNPGPSDAQLVAVTDVVDPAVSSVTVTGGGCTALPCTIPTVAVGSTVTLTVTGVLSPSFAAGSLANSVSVLSPTTGPPPVTATANTAVTTSADLTITKDPTTPSFAAGRAAGWTLTVTNAGPSDAQAVDVVDPIPSQIAGAIGSWAGGTCSGTTTLTCSIGTVAVGQTVTIDVSGTLSGSFSGPSITNAASVTSSSPDPAPGDNSITVSTPVTVEVDLVVTKSASPSPVVPGGPVTWTISVVNNGPGVALATMLTDIVPTAVAVASVAPSTCDETSGTVTCDLGDLAVGQQVDVTIDGTLSPAFAAATLDNTVTVATDSFELTPADNDATSSTPVQPVAPLTVTKTLVEDQLPAGGVGNYEIEVANAGPSDATNVTVTDVVPAPLVVTAASVAGGSCTVAATVVCTISSIAAADSATVTITVSIPSTATGEITNTATASAGNTPGVAPATGSVTSTVQEETLPVTGSDSGRETRLALLLLAAGGALLLISRRRNPAVRADRRSS